MESLGMGLEAPALGAGDGVRLKFLYPRGDVEIVDATWLGVGSLDLTADADRPTWVVLRLGERVVWKPLALLVQIEVLSKGALGEATGGRPERQSRYHG